MNTKEHFIKIFRDHNFICVPIPRYADSVSIQSQKAADFRIKKRENLPIKPTENYAVIPPVDGVWCDFDNKEFFRDFIESLIKKGIMVIESPNGWHVPVINLSGDITKVFLYESKSNATGKPILEILSHKQYVVGCGSDVFNSKANPPRRMFYENKGTEIIQDAKGMYFEDFVDNLVTKLNLHHAANKTPDRHGHYEQRKRFKAGLPPTPGTSNDYWYNAGVVVHSENLSFEEGLAKVKEVYEKWEKKTRSWSNIEQKVRNAYAGKKINPVGGRKKKEDTDEIDADKVVETLLANRRIYSDVDTNQILENKDGYLVNITNRLQKDLMMDEGFTTLKEGIFNAIRFSLIGNSPDIPPTNDDLKVFDNGIWDEKNKVLLDKQTDEIASMGFKGYSYLSPTEENLPKKFMKVMFGNIPEHEIPRVKAALKSALTPRLDSRMTVIHGKSRVGKSAGMTILFSVLNRNSEYAMTVELSQLEDHFIKAKIIGKTLVVLSELPKTVKDFNALKSLTGENKKTERGFHKDAETFTNMIKIIATTNNLPKIPSEEKNAFYSARLSLVHNIRTEPYEYVEDFEKDIVEEEGEKIISWIVNMPEEECQYEDRNTVEKEWEGLASPELEYMNKYWKYSEGASSVPVMKLKKDFESKYQISIPSVRTFIRTLEDEGYYFYKNALENMTQIVTPVIPQSQKKFQSDDD